MSDDIIIEEVILKKVKPSGNASHIILPKKLLGRNVYVLVINENVARPLVHRDRKKESDGVTYLHAEITDNAGTHGLWLKEEDIKNLFTRN